MVRARTLATASFLLATGVLSAAPVAVIHDHTERYCAATHITYEPVPGVLIDYGSVCDYNDAPWPTVGVLP